MTYQDILSFQTAETDFQDIKWLKSCYLYSGEGGCQNAKFLLKKRVNFDSISATYWNRVVKSVNVIEKSSKDTIGGEPPTGFYGTLFSLTVPGCRLREK